MFRDTRMPVSPVFENLQCGSTIEEIIEQYDLTREQIQAVSWNYAARSLGAPPVPVGAASKADVSSSLITTPRAALSGILWAIASRRRKSADGIR